MVLKIKYITLLLILTVGSAFINAYGTVGDLIEKIIAFITPLLVYIAIIALAAKVKGVKIFSAKFLRYFSVMYVVMTIIENIYPMIIYSDQTLPSNYLTVFFLQLSMNIYIARIISNEHD